MSHLFQEQNYMTDIKDNIDEKEYLTKLYDLNYAKKPIINLTSMRYKNISLSTEQNRCQQHSLYFI